MFSIQKRLQAEIQILWISCYFASVSTILKITDRQTDDFIISFTFHRDFMDKNMVRTNRMLSFFYAVLGKIDKQLEQFLIRFVLQFSLILLSHTHFETLWQYLSCNSDLRCVCRSARFLNFGKRR